MAILKKGDPLTVKGAWCHVPTQGEYRYIWSCPECGTWWAMIDKGIGKGGMVRFGLRCFQCNWSGPATFDQWTP